jgi:hypothetical protein|tara:strand:+ start:3667 stop:4515 length:849 start_codon:yes stop_codon:yes gene_type:complete
MATEGKVLVPGSTNYLETQQITQTDGGVVHREGVVNYPHSTAALEIAIGNISGVAGVNKFGRNSDIASGTTEDIWDGSATYVFPATALMTSISQTADQEAMRGATIEVQGLDANWALTIQNATLNASDTTTVVTLGTALIRCFRMKVLANVIGTSPIRVHNAGETTDYAIISTGNNQTLMAIYTVPLGKTAYVIKYHANLNQTATVGPTACNVRFFVRDNANSYERQLKHILGLDPDATSHFDHFFLPYLKVGAQSDIYIDGTTAGKASDVSAGFDLILIDD